MKWMHFRRGLLFFIFLLFPIIQFYFSPFMPVMSAANGVINISIFVFLGLFIIGIFFGRAPCGWFMPCGGLQEACFYFQKKRIRASKQDRIKYIIWVPWLTALATLIILNLNILRIEPFYNMDYGISVSSPQMFIIYYSVLFLLLTIALIFGRRALCHYVCWMAPFMILGRKLGNLFRLPGLRLRSQKEKCIGCKSCNASCPMGIDVYSLIQKNRMHHDECILCGECVQACTSHALRIGLHRLEK